MSGSSELIELINRFLITKGEQVTESEIVLGSPVKLSEVVARAFGKNTRIKVSSSLDPSDEVVLYYNRLDLPTLFGEAEVPVDIDFYTVEAALNRVNELYGTTIELIDLKNYEMIEGYRAKLVVGESHKFLEDSELIIYPKTQLTSLISFSERFHQYVHFTLPKIIEGVPDE